LTLHRLSDTIAIARDSRATKSLTGMAANVNALPVERQTMQLASPEGSRLYFSGPPGGLSGTIPLVNTGPDKQKIRTVGVITEKLQGPARLPLREFGFNARLYGGEQANVLATIVLDSQTPPGRYDFEITLGGRSLPATAHVSEIVDLRIDPNRITILAGPHTSYTRTFVLENAGNVPLPTGAQCEAPIFDSFDLISSLVIGLHKGDRTSAESMAKALLNEWADLQAGVLVTRRKPMVLRPGQKIEIDVEFQLPPSLKPLRHYRANLQLYDGTVGVDIYTSSNYGSRRKSKRKTIQENKMKEAPTYE
jgi:hypothetical protein